MKNYLNHLDKLFVEVNEFLNTNKGQPKSLFLDGTGMLSSYQSAAISKLGLDGLDEFDEIHLVSGATYALFIYLAILEGEFLWSSKDIELWNKNVRKWHNVTPLLSLIKFLTFKYTKLPAGSFGGHRKACQQFFSDEFLNRTLSDFSEKINIWAYNTDRKQLTLISKKNGFGNLTVSDVITMASSVPSIFGSYIHNDEIYIDAMYAPRFSNFKYEVFKGKIVLHLNMFKDGQKDGIRSLKIHEHQNGNELIRRDFYKFLLGLKNHDFELVTKYALFGEIHE